MSADKPSGRAEPTRPVHFIDPETGTEHHLTAREAAEVIIVLQAMEAGAVETREIGDHGYPSMVTIEVALGAASDGEMYREWVEGLVLPQPDEPHVYTPTGDQWGSCEVCRGDERNDLCARPADLLPDADLIADLRFIVAIAAQEWDGASTVDAQASARIRAWLDLLGEAQG